MYWVFRKTSASLRSSLRLCDKYCADYRHSNGGETPKCCGLFTSNAYYVFDIIGGEAVNVHRRSLNARNREIIKALDKKYKSEIYKGTRDSAYWADRIANELSEHLQAGDVHSLGEAGNRVGDLDTRSTGGEWRGVPDAGRDSSQGQREAVQVGERASADQGGVNPITGLPRVADEAGEIMFRRKPMDALAQAKVGEFVEGVSTDGLRNEIRSKLNKGAANGDYRFKSKADAAHILAESLRFYRRFSQKTVMLSDGRCVYFVPDARAKNERGLSNEEAWAEYAIHAVTSSGREIAGKPYRERIFNKIKADSIWRIENILKAERCKVQDNSRDGRYGIEFYGRDANGKTLRIIARPDEAGNIYADLSEVTVLTGGGKTKIPPRMPLGEVVKEAQQRGGLLASDTQIIANSADAGQGGAADGQMMFARALVDGKETAVAEDEARYEGERASADQGGVNPITGLPRVADEAGEIMFRRKLEDNTVRKDVTADVNGITMARTKASLRSLAGRDLLNLATGITARVNAVQRNKIVSNAAMDKSRANGFTTKEHLAAASMLEGLWRHAELRETREDRIKDANIVSIKRFVSPVLLGEKTAYAYITAKESVEHGHRIYSIELESLNTLAGKLKGDVPPTASVSEPLNGSTQIIPNSADAGQGGADLEVPQFFLCWRGVATACAFSSRF